MALIDLANSLKERLSVKLHNKQKSHRIQDLEKMNAFHI